MLLGRARVRRRRRVSGATRPYRALFGGSTANPGRASQFDRHDFGAGRLRRQCAGAGSTGASRSPLLQTGGFLGVSGTLDYAWQTRRVQVAGNIGSTTRYYQRHRRLHRHQPYSQHRRGGADRPARPRVRNQSVSHAPSYLYSLSPGLGSSIPGTAVGGGNFPLGDAADPRIRHDRERRVLGHPAWFDSRRWGAIATAILATASDPTVEALRSYSVGGRFRQGLSRYASLRLGYVYRQGQYGFAAHERCRSASMTLMSAWTTTRALSLTRRTTLDFSTGSIDRHDSVAGPVWRRSRGRLSLSSESSAMSA